MSGNIRSESISARIDEMDCISSVIGGGGSVWRSVDVRTEIAYYS